MFFFIAFILSIIVSLALDYGELGMIITYIVFLALAVIAETIKEKGNVKWELSIFFSELWKNAKITLVFLGIVAFVCYLIVL